MKGKIMKPETSTSQLYCGMDLHSNNVYCALIDETGACRAEKRLPLNIMRILDYIEPYRDKLEDIAVESTLQLVLAGGQIAGKRSACAIG